MKLNFTIDPIHMRMDLFEQELTRDVWADKYRFGDEENPFQSFERVVKGVYAQDPNANAAQEAREAMKLGLWMPAGSIQAAAGTPKSLTYINCFVCQTIPDSVQGISKVLGDGMLTMHKRGGIGMDFSTLRPSGAIIKSTGPTKASGPLGFMPMWNTMCFSIMQAGTRRGAMMGTLADWHPDLPAFIDAKHTPGVLTNFNLSILVSDAFMDAVRNDELWSLYFPVPPLEGATGEFVDENGVTQYIYRQMPAQELWNLIVRSTYEYSEPGVIFIDRVNDLNNLKYCEEIRCTNPCGEQPLPPNGACDLGVVNLARMVINPFTSDAKLSWETLRKAVHVGVRFLDNVIDVTPYPLEEQHAEQKAKRRIGLGVSGLADMLAQLKIRYGIGEAETMTRKVMREVAIQAYTASAALAVERGSFPLFEKEPFLGAPFPQKLPSDLIDIIGETGIRNGVLLTVPPTGTISIYYGNVSPGVEPPFAHTYDRKVLQEDGSREEYKAEGYGYRLWNLLHPTEDVPDYMVTSGDLSVQDHIRIQAACQEWVDASVSKTSNCPAEMTFEDFKEVYTLSYNLGCKGCTTYRPSEVRGSVLSTGEDKPPSRPVELSGKTYKVGWPSMSSALYVTINDKDGHPYEIFISSKSAKNSEWTTALTLMISALMRTRKDIKFIPEELKQVVSAHDSAWIDKVFYGSLVARIADVLERHIKAKEGKPEDSKQTTITKVAGPSSISLFWMDGKEICSSCGNPTVVHQEGCSVCTECGYNSCEG